MTFRNNPQQDSALRSALVEGRKMERSDLPQDDKEMTVPWPAGSQDCRLLNVVGSALLTMTEGR